MDEIRIFVSSPGDVAEERVLSQRLIENLQSRFQGVCKISPIFWEHEPLLASASFQEQLVLPSQTHIVVCILWSRLGTRLPDNIRRSDGSLYASGTEFEFEDALNSFKQTGSPAMLVYQNTQVPSISLNDEAELMDKLGQKKSLDEFVKKWFHNDDGTLKSAFHQYQGLAQFEQKLEQHLQKLIQNLSQQMSGGADVVVASECPFRGLEAFDFEHQDVFFGRTQEVQDIIEVLKHQAADGRSFLLLLGASGSGKSSLVRAGVLPVLMRPGVIPGVAAWRYGFMLPSGGGHGACSALAECLLAQTALPQLLADNASAHEALTQVIREQPDTLVTLIKKALQGEEQGLELIGDAQVKLVLVLDQFEEVFISEHVDEKDRDAFLTALDRMARSGEIWVLATLRSDLYKHVITSDSLMALKEGRGQVDLVAPGSAQIAQMIRQPALFAGLVYEKDPTTGVRLDEVLLDAATQGSNVLPLLSFVLEALYQHKAQDGLLTFEAYQALGGLVGAITQAAESCYLSSSTEAQACLGELFCDLVHVDDNLASRRRALLNMEGASEAKQELVNNFVTARLFVSEQGDEDHISLTLAHEALIKHWPRLSDWVEDNLVSLHLYQQLGTQVKAWLEHDKDDSFLLVGNRLQEFVQWQDAFLGSLSQDEGDYIRLSQEAHLAKVAAEKARQEEKIRTAEMNARRIKLRNNWLKFIATAASGLALLSSLLYFESEAQKGKALTARDQSDELVGFMIEDLSLKLEEVGRLDILTSANQKAFEYLSHQDVDSQSLDNSLRHNALFVEIGYVQSQSGEYDKALNTYQNALQHAQQLAHAHLDNKDAQLQLMVAHFNLGSALWNEGRLVEARTHFTAQQRGALALVNKSPKDLDALQQLSNAYANISAVYNQEHKLARAVEFIQKATQIRNRIIQLTPQDNVVLDMLANDYLWLTDYKLQLKDMAGALEAVDASLMTLEMLAEQAPDNVNYKMSIAYAREYQGEAYFQQGEVAEALNAFSIAQRELAELIALDPQNMEWALSWYSSVLSQNRAHAHLNQTPQALNLYASAAEHGVKLLQDAPGQDVEQAVLDILLAQLALASTQSELKVAGEARARLKQFLQDRDQSEFSAQRQALAQLEQTQL